MSQLGRDLKRIEALGRPAASVPRVFPYSQTPPILTIPATAEKLGPSFPTVSGAIGHLRKLGVLREITGKQRRRLFVYPAYMTILNEGTEPLR